MKNTHKLLVSSLLTLIIANSGIAEAHENHHKQSHDSHNHEHHKVATKNIVVSNQWIRSTPPNAPTTAAYFTLTNQSPDDIRLIGIRSNLSDRVEIHTHSLKGDVIRMLRVENVVIPKNSSLDFEPGGNHIMFIGLKENIGEHKSVNITLEFSDGTERAVKLVAKRKASTDHEHKHHH